MRFLLTILLMALFSGPGWAATWYFSIADGDDSRSTTLAQSPSTPWKTLTKLNTQVAGMSAGDIILLKRGEVFTGNITLTQGVTLGAYGSGNDPVVTGLVTLSSWTSLGGGIWESTALPGTSSLNMLLIDGVEYAKGRYPNEDASNKGWLTYESHASNTSITDNNTVIDPSWATASTEIVIKTRHFAIDKGAISTITNPTASSTTLTYSNSTFAYTSLNGDKYGYFLQNTLSTLDRFGEWVFDKNTRKVAVYFGSAGPSSRSVQVATTDVLVAANSSNITIRDLAITGANTYSIYSVTPGSNLSILNCTISFSGIDHIFLKTRTNITVDNCVLDWANSNAISANYRDDNTIVTNTLVNHTGMFPGMMTPDAVNRVGDAIFSDGQLTTGLTVRNCVVKNTGYMGIFFSHSNNLIENNYIDTACTWMDDGGGIYTGNYTSNGGTPLTQSNNIIRNNVVLNVKGSPQGTDNTLDSLGHGIYVDDWSNHVDIYGNTCAYNGFSGIFVHNGNTFTIRDNNLFDNGGRKGGQLYYQDDDIASAVYGGVATLNQLYSTRSTQLMLYMQASKHLVSAFNGSDTSFRAFVSSDSNWFGTPFNSIIAYTNCFSCDTTVKNWTLPAWKAYSGDELHTLLTPVTVTAATVVQLVYNETSDPADKVLDGSYVSMDNLAYTTGVITLPPYSSAILFKTSNTITSAAGDFRIYPGKKIIF